MVKGLVCGVGVNDADYKVTEGHRVNGKVVQTWVCPYYKRWFGMINRCYSTKSLKHRPTYVGCSVCDEWLTFSNFKKWMEQQEWEGRSLDKDFLAEGNKVYSPDTCLFVPLELNNFTVTSATNRGKFPLGVTYRVKGSRTIEHVRPYLSKIKNRTGSSLSLGGYATPEEAHQRYLTEKLKQCENYLKEFKDEPLITKGLTRIKDKILFHIENNLELTSF